MTISDDLFQLIKSLKQTEKRYFKIFASIHVKGEQNNYVKLFDAIDRQQTYDEKVLLKEFKGETFVKQFAVTKNYLYNFILRALRGYYSGSDAESQIHEELDNIKILFGKGMYKKCMKLVKKAKSIASKFDKYELLLNLIKWENEIATRSIKGVKLDEFRVASNKEIKAAIEVMEEKYLLRLLEQQAFKLYRRITMARSIDDIDQYDQILQDPAMGSGSLPRSFIGKLRYYNIHGVYKTLLDEHEEAHNYDYLRYELFEKEPHFIKENLIQYIKVQNNLMHNYMEMGDLENFNAILKNVREIGEKYAASITNTERAIIFETSYVKELAHYYHSRSFDKALELIPLVEKQLKSFENVLVIEFKTDIEFTIAKIYFYTGQPDEALDWVNKIVAQEKPNAAVDLICMARILNILIHFDLGNEELLKYEIKSTRRFLSKKKRLFQVEDHFLKSLNRVVNLNEQEQRIKTFAKFREKLGELAEEQYESKAFKFIDLLAWADSKLKQKTLQQMLEAAGAIPEES